MCTVQSNNDIDIDLDLTLFKDINAEQPNDGRSADRIGVVLQYRQRLRNAGKSASEVRQITVEFCDVSYPAKVALADYIAFVKEMSDEVKKRQFVSRFGLQCGRVAVCAVTRRHFRGRRSDSAEEEQTHVRHGIVDRLDTLHFNLLHLTELGFRARADEEKGDADDEAESEELKKAVMGIDSAKFTLSVSDKGRFSLSLSMFGAEGNEMFLI